jgi:hypothetical protein
VRIDPTLSWRVGRYVDTHDIYFGTDETKVTDANRTNHPDVDFNNVSVNSYVPATLEFETTYYWRIDEVNTADEPSMWKGDIWSFTTGNYLVVEDFDSYPTDNTLLRNVWQTNPGALISVETSVVSDGNSVKFDYDNYYSPFYSEASADVCDLPSQIGSDWTVNDTMEQLVLYFYGNAENDANEQMYVKLTDGDGSPHTAKVIYDDDMDDIKEAEWHQWSILLQDFTNVSLTNVAEITIGFGDGNDPYPAPNPAGTVYFDDIRLYPARCILSKRSPSFAKIDYAPVDYPLSGDCIIDYQELAIMGSYWLVEDAFVDTCDPGLNGLVAYYPIDAGSGDILEDVIGDHNGEFSTGGVTWTSPGFDGDGNAIHMDGSEGTRVSLGTWNPTEPNGQLTLAIWVKWDGPRPNPQGQPQGLICKRDDWSSADLMFMFEMDTPDSAGQRGTFSLRQHSNAGTDVYSPTHIMTPFIGQWTHLAATFDGTTGRLYLNGGEVASGPFSFGGKTNAGMTIGNNSSESGWPDCPGAFNGDIDEARIYNRALDPSEVAYLAAGEGEVYAPVWSPAEVYDYEAQGSRVVNFRDFALVAKLWLANEILP